MLATGFISFGVWAHHMFTTGMPPLTTGFFSAASMAVCVPAGIQVFSWIATLAIGKRRFNAPRSEEPTSELQSLMRTSTAVLRLRRKTTGRAHASDLHFVTPYHIV